MTKANSKLSKRMLDFMDYQLACCKPSTVGSYHPGLSHFHDCLKHFFHTSIIYKVHMTFLSKSQLQEYILSLNRKKLAPYTRVNYLLTVKKYLVWEIEQGTINESLLSVLDRKHLPKVPEYLPKPLSVETDRSLIMHWRNIYSRYSKIFLLIRFTGLRISELINLPPDCVICNHKNEHYLKVPLGKMNNERFVPLSNETLAIISSLKEDLSSYSNPNRLIGFHGNITSVYGHLRVRFIKSVGHIFDQGKPITFHRLRHTYATSLISGGASIVSIMKLLGHRKIEMSLRYAKVTPSHLRREFLDAIGSLEKKWISSRSLLHKNKSQIVKPDLLISHLRTFVDKAVVLDSKNKKILLRRLSRLQQYLSSISFSQKFTPHF